MSDMGDPKFKLFGKTIPLSSDGEEVSGDSIEKVAQHDADKGLGDEKSSDDTSHQNDSCPRVREDENPDAETEKESPEKTLKKPEKILPCPRCNSMDTKFCYYNNYNVHQPRHFCKGCQRYWTAGGTMRNVPVGAGRRKNKSASSKYCHVSISDALQAAAHMDGVHHTHQQQHVLTFGVGESMASMTNLAEKKVLNGVRSGLQVHPKSGENGDDRSSGSSSVTTSGSVEEGGAKGDAQFMNGFPGHHQVPFFPGFQLAYGWNPAIQMPPPPPPGFCQSAAFPPIPFYPAPFWNVPWPGSSASLPTLGKHSRDETEKRSCPSQVLLPKTLRIDNPEEAAKSSIWTTLGINKVETSGNGGFFKGLQLKGEEKKKHRMENSPLLNANPAAVARSIRFQETA